MGYMTWRVMFGSGVQTGMMLIITASLPQITLRVHQAGSIVWLVAVAGRVAVGIPFVLRIEATTTRPAATNTGSAFARINPFNYNAFTLLYSLTALRSESRRAVICFKLFYGL